MALLRITHNLAANFIETNTLRPFVDALEIAALFAVHLRQCHDMLQRLIFRLHQPKNFGALDVETSCSGKMDLVA